MGAPLDRIVAIVGEEHVLRDGPAMEPFLQEWRRVCIGKAAAVVRPGSTDEVAAIVALCAERGTPITPQGGNTGLCGGAVPLSADGILLNLSRMARIREIDAAGFTLTAEAGAVLAEVQQAAANCNRLFPLSLGSEGTAQIGGLVSTNAGGMQVMRYGTMRELVLGLEVVLPDGRILNGLSALRKDTTGYDLKQLFIGAEGTLGIVTAATLKLYPAIASRRTVFLGLPNSEAAVAIFSQLRERVSDRLLAAELIANACIDLALANVPAARNPLHGRHAWYLLVEFDNLGDDSDTILQDALMPALETGLAEDAVVALSIDQAHRMWFLREAIVEGERLEAGSAKHDISLPISAIPEFLACAGSRIETAMPGIRIAPFGHVGDGNLHYNLVRPVGMERADFIAASLALTNIVHAEVTRRAGSISAEHGIGLFKRDALSAHKSQLHLELMHRIKQVFDPRGLMNPHKVLSP